jgi:hypothetical protein
MAIANRNAFIIHDTATVFFFFFFFGSIIHIPPIELHRRA